MENNKEIIPCKICGSNSVRFLGEKRGRFIDKSYKLFNCSQCGFTFISNPSLDYENIYNLDYYLGEGADPTVNYLFELEHPEKSIRTYEWRGIVKTVSNILENFNKKADREITWLDFGCGTGGLVQWLQENTNYNAMGFEEKRVDKLTSKRNLKILDRQELIPYRGYFDIVTATEVLEHTIDPLEVLKLIRTCLKPGGIFFFTTGNAEKFKKNILNWSYILPEIHVSFFEPKTIIKAFELSGFRPVKFKDKTGFEEIIIFKILKNLGIKRLSQWQNYLPKKILTDIADNLYGVTAFPFGEAI